MLIDAHVTYHGWIVLRPKSKKKRNHLRLAMLKAGHPESRPRPDYEPADVLVSLEQMSSFAPRRKCLALKYGHGVTFRMDIGGFAKMLGHGVEFFI